MSEIDLNNIDWPDGATHLLEFDGDREFGYSNYGKYYDGSGWFFDMDEWENMANQSKAKQAEEANRIRKGVALC